MKRTMILLVLGAMLLTMLPLSGLALEILKVSLVKQVEFNAMVVQAPVMTITNQTAAPVAVTVEVFDEAARANVETMQFTLQAGGSPYSVIGRVYKPLQHNGQINTYRYKVTTAGGYKNTLYFAQILHMDKKNNTYAYTHTENPVFWKNTVTSFGPQFRIVKPELTKEWYMFTPIDLSVQGRQTFPLIGGNARVVGDVFVDVNGDTVNVTYQYNLEHVARSKVERVSEYLNFFPAFSAVTTVVPENLPSAYAFGRPFSIANQLGNDTKVLMFVRNMETFYRYPTPTQEMPRFFPNNQQYVAMRQHMLDIMDPTEGLNLQNLHNYADGVSN